MNEPASNNSGEWLQHLHLAGQWARLEHFAAENLATDPDDITAHFHRAWALLKLKRPGESGPHVRYLLNRDAESVAYLKLAAVWHLEEGGRAKQARKCLDAAIKTAPDEASLWHLAAISDMRRYKFESARRNIIRARELDPDNANIAHLHILLFGMERTGAEAAWQTVSDHETALELDPENDSLIAGLGDVYLNELEMPEQAEALYRQALAIDPTDQRHQRRLWQAMQKRNLLFRTLCLPFSGTTLALNMLRGLRVKPWMVIFFIIGAKFVLIYLAWLFAVTLVFAPPALLVEWLVMADLQRASRTAEQVGHWWLDFHHLPMAFRLTCCLMLMAVFWWALFAWIGISQKSGFMGIGVFFLAHLGIMAIRVFMRRSKSRSSAAHVRRPPSISPA